LIGGQACVFYGAAEFSRDTDLVLLASEDNLLHLRSALRELKARRIAVPPFELHYLLRGHGIHFKCDHPDARGMRIDIMAVMRGVEPFGVLWERRERIVDDDEVGYDLISLRDLVQSKKTQRDKDWPMLRRLVEADYVAQKTPSRADVQFWLQESRTPSMLVELAAAFPDQARALAVMRPALNAAVGGDATDITAALCEEEEREREIDRIYWEPLRRELEVLRHGGHGTEEVVTET
jgi:hypothetical protein